MDFNEIVGQEHVKRALEVAITGDHKILLLGPTGHGSGMLIKAATELSDAIGIPGQIGFKAEHTTMCRCGFYGDTLVNCICVIESVRDWLNYIRRDYDVDMRLEVPRLKSEEIVQIGRGGHGEKSATIFDRIVEARKFGRAARKGQGDSISAARFKITDDVRDLMRSAIAQLMLSPDTYVRVLRMARTIADLDGRSDIGLAHIAEALQYRALDRKLTG